MDIEFKGYTKFRKRYIIMAFCIYSIGFLLVAFSFLVVTGFILSNETNVFKSFCYVLFLINVLGLLYFRFKFNKDKIYQYILFCYRSDKTLEINIPTSDDNNSYITNFVENFEPIISGNTITIENPNTTESYRFKFVNYNEIQEILLKIKFHESIPKNIYR